MESSFTKRLKKKILHWLHLTNEPVIKLYNGYGNKQKVIVFGHVLKLSPLPRKKYRKSFINNSYGLLRLFMVKPFACIGVQLAWDNIIYKAEAQDDGFFRFEFEVAEPLSPGWHRVSVRFSDEELAANYKEASGEFFIPYNYRFAFISDIDDTFLISHSSNLRKRLYILFTKNARSRKPFEGVVNHYKLLASSGASRDTFNLFFYVSSSEWNLYDYISEFAKINQLPKGIYLLNQLKEFSKVFKTGQNNHATKFMRISRIMEAYPSQKFILLGDDSQKDPDIYLSITQHFPNNIYAVYLRQVVKQHYERVRSIADKIEQGGVQCCYFEHSSEAVIHSKKISLIANDIA